MFYFVRQLSIAYKLFQLLYVRKQKSFQGHRFYVNYLNEISAHLSVGILFFHNERQYRFWLASTLNISFISAFLIYTIISSWSITVMKLTIQTKRIIVYLYDVRVACGCAHTNTCRSCNIRDITSTSEANKKKGRSNPTKSCVDIYLLIFYYTIQHFSFPF